MEYSKELGRIRIDEGALSGCFTMPIAVGPNGSAAIARLSEGEDGYVLNIDSGKSAKDCKVTVEIGSKKTRVTAHTEDGPFFQKLTDIVKRYVKHGIKSGEDYETLAGCLDYAVYHKSIGNQYLEDDQ
jgi:hypothetical protein